MMCTDQTNVLPPKRRLIARRAVIMAVTAAVIAMAAAAPPPASAGWVDYLTSGCCASDGSFRTIGFAPRYENRVYHEEGIAWGVYYCGQSGDCTTGYVTSSNPTVDTRDHSYAEANCSKAGSSSTWGYVWVKCETLS